VLADILPLSRMPWEGETIVNTVRLTAKMGDARSDFMEETERVTLSLCWGYAGLNLEWFGPAAPNLSYYPHILLQPKRGGPAAEPLLHLL